MLIIKDSDFRKFPRRSFDARVRIQDYIHGRTVNGRATDINPMGMFLETKRPFHEGETLSLTFPSPNSTNEFKVTGEVVRIQPGTGAQKPGVAIEFFGHEDWIFEEICAYVYDSEDANAITVEVDSGNE